MAAASTPSVTVEQLATLEASAGNPYAFIGIPSAERDTVLADQLELMLTGGNPSDDSPYDIRFVQLCVQESRIGLQNEIDQLNERIRQEDFVLRQKLEKDSYFDDLRARREDEASADRWIQAFRIKLLLDVERDEQYFLLPQAFVQLRRYQNLPGEEGVRDIEALRRTDRGKYPFVYVPNGIDVLSAGVYAGGLQGNWGFYYEQYNGEHRVYLIPPTRLSAKIPDDFPLRGRVVVRESRLTSLPTAPLRRAASDWEILRRALDLALLRTKPDLTNDNAPITSPPSQ